MHVVILGGGRQGQVVAKDLIDSGFSVTVADMAECNLPGASYVKADLSNKSDINGVIVDSDMVVSCLPSHLGYGAIEQSILCKKNCVDMSYCNENIMNLDYLAKANRVSVLPDCGVAPGMSNLIAGRASYKIKPNKISIQVGGFSRDPNAPYGYALTWSPDDLLEEFKRPSRVIEGGHIVTKKVLSGIDVFNIDGIGKLESFYTDGLRTMLYSLPDTPYIEERTIRRFGTTKLFEKMVSDDTFLKEMDKCAGVEDMLYMRIIADDTVESVTVYAENGLTAMARSTALSCSSFVKVLANGFIDKIGVIPPELLAEDDGLYSYYIDLLATHNILFSNSSKVSYPFFT